MSTAPSNSLKVCKLWPLERYARLLQEKEQFLHQTQPAAQAQVQNIAGSSWKHYFSATNSTIQMSLLEDNHLMVSHGNQIYESVSLWEAKKWIKGVTKGDTALFIYRMNGENRRFRVKFLPMTSGGSSIAACKHCSSVLSSFMSMSEMQTPAPTLPPMDTGAAQPSFSQPSFSQSQVLSLEQSSGVAKPPGKTVPAAQPENSTNCKRMAVSEIAKVVQVGGRSLGEAYANTNFPTEQLGSFIRLCLTDANFPGFVEAVEKELNAATKP